MVLDRIGAVLALMMAGVARRVGDVKASVNVLVCRPGATKLIRG
jgi:hypothetical protein